MDDLGEEVYSDTASQTIKYLLKVGKQNISKYISDPVPWRKGVNHCERGDSIEVVNVYQTRYLDRYLWKPLPKTKSAVISSLKWQ